MNRLVLWASLCIILIITAYGFIAVLDLVMLISGSRLSRKFLIITTKSADRLLNGLRRVLLLFRPDFSVECVFADRVLMLYRPTVLV